MDLSHEVRGSGRTRRAGLAAVVLAGSIGVGSMSGCGAALIAGAGYLAAEEIAQSNVEAARIRARRQTNADAQGGFNRELAATNKELELKLIACNSIDPSLDGDASSVSEEEIIGRRMSLPALFRDDEPICFSAFIYGDCRAEKTTVKVVNGKGSTIYASEFLIDYSKENQLSNSFIIRSEPGRLAPGYYKVVWHLDGNFLGALDAEVRSSSPVLTQK